MLLFLWGRLRYDLVALLALLASVAGGTVDPKAAFTGFSDDIVIIVASALLISAAVARSGIVEAALHRRSCEERRAGSSGLDWVPILCSLIKTSNCAVASASQRARW